MPARFIFDSKTDLSNGMWQLDGDYECQICGYYQPMSAGSVCRKCGTKIDSFVFLINDSIPLNFKTKEQYDYFSENYFSLLTLVKLNDYKIEYETGNLFISIGIHKNDDVLILRFTLEKDGGLFRFSGYSQKLKLYLVSSSIRSDGFEHFIQSLRELHKAL